MKEKSILEQALLQVKTLEEAVKQNAKGILASTMKQELNDLLKESMEEEDEVVDGGVQPADEQSEPSKEEDDDVSDDEATDTEAGEPEGDEDLDNKESDPLDTTGSDDETSDDDFGSTEEPSLDEPSADSDDLMDMTGSSDEEVLKVFKAMKPEDGIVVKKDGDNVEFKDEENEYIIKLDSDEDETSSSEEGLELPDEGSEFPSTESDETSFESNETPTDENEGGETIYEIEVDEEEESHEEETTEAARTKSNPHGNKGGQNRAGLPSKKKYQAGSEPINEEVEKLKKQNSEYKKALILFKEKLNEVAVFNANLAYATRLFTENTTTKQEKMSILKRFDSVSTMNESKNLFTTIKTELGTKKPVTESVVEKISITPTPSSTEVLSEAKAYENPQFKRMKELMKVIK